MSYYQKHLFFCTNVKSEGKKCCSQNDSPRLSQYARDCLQKQALYGPGKIRVSQAGCLGRCQSGPCLVIYPDNIWYTYRDEKDVDLIIESYLKQGQVVDSLLLESINTD